GNDLDQLFGDHALPGAVVRERLLADHLAGVAGGVVHCAHLSAIERGVVLEQRAEDLNCNVAWQQLIEDVVLVWLIFVSGSGTVAFLLGYHRRNDLLGGRYLRNDRFEAREKQRADVECALVVERDHPLRYVLRVHEGDLANGPQLNRLDDLFFERPFDLVVTFAANAEKLHLFALCDQRRRALARKPHDRRVERAAQAALAGADEQEMDLVLAGSGQQLGRGGDVGNRFSDLAENPSHALRIRPRRFGRALRTPEFRCGDHLHGFGDLLRRLGGGDAHPHVLQARHGRSVPSSCYAPRHANDFA